MQLSLQPPAGALAWRVLRKGADTFGDENDPQALVAYTGVDRVFVDAEPGLINGAPMFYRPYYWTGSVWLAGNSASGTPQATFEDVSCDAQRVVRNRLEEAFKVAVERGQLVLPEGLFAVQVLTSPPMVDQVVPPVVTVHMEVESSGDRGIGEILQPDFLGLDGDWLEQEGWLADVTLEIAAWSGNPDERAILRGLLRTALISNLSVFDAAGMVEINVSLRDVEFLNGEFGEPMFQVACTLTCKAPVIVRNALSPIGDVEVSATAFAASTT